MADIRGMRLAELKAELSKRGLSTEGRKRELARRLEGHKIDCLESPIARRTTANYPEWRRLRESIAIPIGDHVNAPDLLTVVREGAVDYAIVKGVGALDTVRESYLAHELGHNLGMNHARSMECGSPLYYSTGGQGCSYREYGNYNDVMGNGEGVHFSGYYQRYLGWIGARHVVTAGRDGVFTCNP